MSFKRSSERFGVVDELAARRVSALGKAVPDPLESDLIGDEAHQRQGPQEFLLDLIGAADDVPLGEGELPGPDQPAQGAAGFVSEKVGGLAVPDGEVPVAVGLAFVELELEGAGHGPQGKVARSFVVHRQEEHDVAVEIPMPGDLVQRLVGHEGRGRVLVAPPYFLVLDEPDQFPTDRRAAGRQQGKPLSDDRRLDEKVERFSELDVILH
jgi:hypothetical protein